MGRSREVGLGRGERYWIRGSAGAESDKAKRETITKKIQKKKKPRTHENPEKKKNLK